MSFLKFNKKNFKVILSIFLMLSNILAGFPTDLILENVEDLIRERKIVDVLYWTTKDDRILNSIVDNGLPRMLNSAHATTTTYDFSTCSAANTCDSSTSHWASDDDVDVFPFGGVAANRNNHIESTDLQYTALGTSDTNRLVTADPGNGDSTFFWFEFDIAENPANITRIDFTYEGYTTLTANYTIYVKDDTTSYELDSAWTAVGTANSIAGGVEESFTRSFLDDNFADYIDANGIIIWGVFHDNVSEVSNTDYVKMTVATNTVEQEGYRWRNDDGSETTATWKQAQDTNITEAVGTNVRLRTILNDTAGGDQETSRYQIEYKLSSDSVYRPVGASGGSKAMSVSVGTSSADGTTSIDVSYPGTVDRGDMAILGIASKYPTNGPSTPTGWNALTNYRTSGGVGTTGADTGQVYVSVYTRECEGWEDGRTVTINISSGNSAEGGMVTFDPGTGYEWDVALVNGSDNTANSTWSVTAGADPGIIAQDKVIVVNAINTDLYDYSTPALTATGLSSVSSTERVETASIGGDDVELVMVENTIVSGTASTAPVFTMTPSGSSATAPAGAAVFVRIRLVDAPIQLSPSSNITASGENTTAQLTAPTGGPTFTAGRIQDDENPADTVDINDSQYTEMEWSMIATSQATGGEIYQFRVTSFGNILTTYTVTPQWTIANAVTLSGTVYTNETGTNIGANKTVNLRIDGVGSYTDETDASGVWSISSVIIESGDIITAYLDNETEEGTTVLLSNGTAQSNIHIYQNVVMVRHDTGTSIIPDNLYTGDDGDDDVKYSVSASTNGNLTVDSGFEFHVWLADTFDTSGGTITTQGGGNLHVGDTARAIIDTSGNIIAGDIVIEDSGLVNMNNSTTINGGDITTIDGGSIASNAGTVTMGASGTLGGGGLNSTFQLTNLTISSGTTTLGSDQDNILILSGDLSVSAGATLAMNNKTLDVNGGNLSTVGTGAITCASCTSGGVNLSGDGSTNGIGGGTGEITIYDLTLDGGINTTAIGTATISILGTVNISDGRELSAYSSGTIYVAGSWILLGSGSFTANSSEVILNGSDGSTQNLSGGTTFYDLTISTNSNTTGRTVQFEDGTSTTINGTWTVTGYSGKVITLQSTDGAAWNVEAVNSSVTYVTVSDSNNTGAIAICATFSSDGTGNTNWTITGGASCGGGTTYTQNDFEWFVTDTSVTLSNSWPVGGGENISENTAMTQIPATNEPLNVGDKIRIQLSFTIGGTNLSATTQAFKLQYGIGEDCTAIVSWLDVGGTSATDKLFRLFDEGTIGPTTTQVNQISTSTAGAEGYYSELNPSSTNPNAVNVGQSSEWDWPVENYNASGNTTYCFRMIKSDDNAFDVYNADSYPKLTTAPGTDVLLRHGNFWQNELKKGFFWAN